MNIQVTKRDGSKEPLNIDKLHKVVFWATEGLSGVSASEVELRSQIQFYNKMTTEDIQETMIKSAADLISEEAPNYQYVAGRLVNYQLRKEVYGRFQPTRLYDLIKKNSKAGFYDKSLLSLYTEEEWDEINGFVNHERDMALTYAAMEQMRGKYLVRNRVNGAIYETPQVLYALVAAILFSKYPAETRIKWVRDYYDAISKHEISLPTPIMAGVRTPERQFASCLLVESDDSLDSIIATNGVIMKYVSLRAGIGIGAGSIRALGSPVRGGSTSHTGVTPYFKHFQTAVNSCSQGGVRKGSATLYYPIWHLEVETMLVLKNNKGIEDNRVRGLDYGVQFTKLFYERFITDGDITLFSPSDVPGLYNAFFEDQDLFRELYEAAEANPKIRKKVIRAQTLFEMFAQERIDTGRVYLMNVDNANTHSSFDEKFAPVRMSNLCTEINLPTKPLEHLHDEDGEIALCTLSAINWGIVKSPADFERLGRLAIRALDELLDYQHYPVAAARNATMARRPLGVGIINFAYFLAKNGVRYSDGSANGLVDRWAEAWSYYLIKASMELAIEKGACPKSHETKYSKGIVPIDTRKRDVDELVPHEERLDWEWLREQLREHGIRNSTVMAVMPAECQKWSNKINLADGRALDFHELLAEKNIDWEAIEATGIPARYAFDRPVMVNTQNGAKPAYEFYYNGHQEIFEVTFDDSETYGFTGNHLFEVKRHGHTAWCRVDELIETDLNIRSIKRMPADHTWDISIDGDEYLLPNGVVSHNTSAQIANATNGIEPPRAYVSIKGSKDGVLKQVVPGFPKFKNKYELLWDQESPIGYLQLAAILQKYIDQGISVNTSYNPKFYPNGEIPMSEILGHLLLAYKWGHKQLYYNNTNDGQGEITPEELEKMSKEEKAVVLDQEHCESCAI